MIRMISIIVPFACTACSAASPPTENITSTTRAVPPTATGAPSPKAVSSPEPVATADPGLNEADLSTYPQARGFPFDVQRFMVRRADCEHWAGEEPYDADRKREIEQALHETCTGVDRELDRLRRVYGSDARVTAALKTYDKVNYRP